MKKFILIAIAFSFIACEKEVQKDYVTFSGTITKPNSDSLVLSAKDFSKVIRVKEDGTFSDTLKVTPGFYRLYDGGEYSSLFLKNGFDLNMTLDTEQFDETIAYTGEGADDNNFLADKARKEELLFDVDVEGMTEADLDQKFSEIETEMNEFLASKATLDTMVVNTAREGFASSVKGYKRYLGNLIALRTNLPKGAPSPIFTDFENHKGGTTSLTDLKGKYVYVDVWATWCGPCKVEIPHLKKVEEEFADKNIAFVSISIDREKDHQKWVDMVNEKQLGGIQLFSDANWKSDFVTAYYIDGIPRFLLIDPDGNIVTPDAPRPSSPKLKVMLEELI